MDGRATLAGVDLDGLSSFRLMNVVTTVMHEAGFVVADIEPETETPEVSPEKWGETPEAIAAQEAFMGFGR